MDVPVCLFVFFSLENCCKAKSKLEPTKAEKLFPEGGLIVLSESAILGWDTLFRRLFGAIDRAQKRTGAEWRVKIHRETLTNIKTLAVTPPIQVKAVRAVEIFDAYMVSLPVLLLCCEQQPLLGLYLNMRSFHSLAGPYDPRNYGRRRATVTQLRD